MQHENQGEILYKHSPAIHNIEAAKIVVPLILTCVRVHSVLDVGCGIGSWLKVFLEYHGLEDIMGIDGGYVDYAQLVIPEQYFKAYDLRKPFDLHRKFDLVLSLEVGEHLPKECADLFVECLCKHSDNVIFSAAIPGQAGQNHVNEQWPEYWEEKFKSLGYTRLDPIRPQVWGHAQVDVWYKQNIFLFTRDVELIKRFSNQGVTATIHPQLWEMKVAALNSLQRENKEFDNGGAGIIRSYRALINAIKNKF